MRATRQAFLIAAVLLMCSLPQPASAAKDRISFSLEDGIDAEVSVHGNDLTWTIQSPGGTARAQTAIETDKRIDIKVDDYDFTGRPGFSISYADAGMGTFDIYRVFTFSRARLAFVERFPACGDEFLNLRVDKVRKRLVSSYYRDSRPTLCTTRLRELNR